MSELVISRGFVRKLTQHIESVYGHEVKHTLVVGMVADALGWRTDALMHKLKSEESPKDSVSCEPVAYIHPESGKPFEAPENIDDHTLGKWVLRRMWRSHESDLFAILYDEDEAETREFDRDILVTCIAICRLVLRNPEGALSIIEGMPETDERVVFIRALADFRLNGPSPAIDDRIASSLKDFSGGNLPGFSSPWIDTDHPSKLNLNPAGMGSAFGLHVTHMLRDEIGKYIIPITLNRGILLGGGAAVPISESVSNDGIICLFDGVKRKMLHRHIKAKFGMTADDYRTYWGLPADYPMTAPGYSNEKLLAALGRPVTPSPRA